MRLQLNHSKEICVSHYILATALALTWATRLLAVEPGAAHGWGTWYKLPETRGVIDFIDVKACSDYTIGLRSDGTVVVWGVDNNGVISFLPEGLTNVIAIAAGEFMPMALTSEGRVRVWGTGGHVYSSAILNVPPAATNVIAIAGGRAHCLALRADGTVVAWGGNSFGECNVPSGLTNVVKIAAGSEYSLAFTSDGAPVAWGNDSFYRQVPATVRSPKAIALGMWGHGLALLTNGTVVAWGNNSSQQTNVPPGLTNVVAIAAGQQHSVALKSDGTLVAWGLNSEGQGSVPTGFPRARAIAAGSKHNAVISGAPLVESISPRDYLWIYAGTNLTLNCSVAAPVPYDCHWVRDGFSLGRTGNPVTFTNVQAGHSGRYWMIASNELGSTVSPRVTVDVLASAPVWQLLPREIAVLPGEGAAFHALAAGSEPLTYQWSLNGVPLLNATNPSLSIPQVSVSDEGVYTVTVTNLFGRITSPSVVLASTLPFLVEQPPDIRARTNWTVSLETRVLSSLPVTYRWFKNGQVFTGPTGPEVHFSKLIDSDNGDYFLVASNGYGSVTSRTASVTIISGHHVRSPAGAVVDWGGFPYTRWPALQEATNVVAIAGSTTHTLALTDDNKLRVWCSPEDSALSATPSQATNVVDVFAGPSYNLAVRDDGAAFSWGNNVLVLPQGSVGSYSDVVSAACGGRHMLLLKRNGTVLASPSDYPIPANATNLLNVSIIGETSFGLCADGKVLRWPVSSSAPDGSTGAGMAGEVPALAGCVELAGGAYNMAALRRDGTVVWWSEGTNWGYVAGITNAVSVVGGLGFSALLQNGEVRSWGDVSTPDVPSPLIAYRIASGFSHVMALTRAPFFDLHPQSQQMYASGDCSFTAEVRSVSPLSLQWFLGEVPLAGETNKVLSLRNVKPAQAGSYRLRASNSTAEVFSQSATLTISGPAQVMGVSGSLELPAGDTLTLNAEFVANPAGSVRWQYEGFSLPDATGTTLVLSNVTESASGYYGFTVSNVFGAVTSPAVFVNVTSAPPKIVTQPSAPSELPDGSALDLQVRATGSLPITYQWFFNGDPIEGETSSMLRVTNASLDKEGNYWVRASNFKGHVVSQTVAIRTTRVVGSASFGRSTKLVLQGKPFRLEPSVTGTPGSMQWRVNGSDLQGETNSVLNIAAASLANSGEYSLSISNTAGISESSLLRVIVLPHHGSGMLKLWAKLTTTTLNQVPFDELIDGVALGNGHGLVLLPDGNVRVWSANNTYGETAVPLGLSNVVAIAANQDFSLALRDSGDVVGWGRNNYGQSSPPAGLSNVVAVAAGPSYSLALRADGKVIGWGQYPYANVPEFLTNVAEIAAGPTYCLAAMSNGLIAVWGNPGPSITNIPNHITNITQVAAGNTRAFAVDRSGTFSTWGSGSPYISGLVTNVSQVVAGLDHVLVLKNDGRVTGWGTDYSSNVSGPSACSNVLALAAGPSSSAIISREVKLLNHPKSRTISGGSPVLLSVRAAGSPRLQYQWFLNSEPIRGATNAEYFIPDFGMTNEGDYLVQVENPWSVVKTNFNLALGLAPKITRDVADVVVVTGSNAVFSIQAVGTPNMAYQWWLNGAKVYGANGPQMTLYYATYADKGRVFVTVSNLYGGVISREATLNVIPPPSRLGLIQTNGTLRIKFLALQPNRSYSLMSSTNLIDWTEIQAIDNGITSLEVGSSTNLPTQFFRLIDLAN